MLCVFFLNGCGKDDEILQSAEEQEDQVTQTDVQAYNDKIFEVHYDNGTILYYRIDSSDEVAVTANPYDTCTYKGDIIIPKTFTYSNTIYNVRYIDYKAFINSPITSIQFPETLTYIDEYAFYGCDSLRQIKIPSKVIYIGNYAFNSCKSLEALYFNAENCIVCNYVFRNCPNLETIYLNTENCVSGFSGCDSLKNVYIDAAYPVLDDNSFSYCHTLEKVSFSDNAKEISIGAKTFYNCEKLKEINLGKCISIGEYAFGMCENLEYVDLAECPSIEPGAFSFSGLIEVSLYKINKLQRAEFLGCHNLSTVTLGEDLEFFSTASLINCDKLESITFQGNTPPKCVDSVSNKDIGWPDVVNIYVPQGCVDTYNSAFPSSLTLVFHELD